MTPRMTLPAGIVDVAPGIRRLTFALPLGIDHVHCYLVRSDSGGWMLVDTALGLPGAEEQWRAILAGLDSPLERVVVTHFHPDHVGGAGIVAGLTGAPVSQGRLDYDQCLRVWGDPASRDRLERHLLEHGVPAGEVRAGGTGSERLRVAVRFARDPEPLEQRDRVGGWDVLHLPGHADGHLALVRDGVLLAGDTLLAGISPAVGLYPESRPDPLGDFLDSLARLVELAPLVAYAGHGPPIADPAARARELIEHHAERLEAVERALGPEPASAYDLSLAVFPAELPPAQRRFAVAESLAHLEHLVRLGRARGVAGVPRYAAA